MTSRTSTRNLNFTVWIVLGLGICACSSTRPGQGSGVGVGADGRAEEIGMVDAPGGQEDAASAPVPGFCEPNVEDFPQRPDLTEPASLPFLRVEGAELVDALGAPVALRGINFGSWLMMETWIAGIGVEDEGDLLDLLRAEAAALGLADALAAAELTNALDWVLERRSHYVLAMEWRAHMLETATRDTRAAVEQLWAWFDEQPWIFEEEALWSWLEGRFGNAKTQQLRQAFHESYITELDVERVAGLGLNLIRVPVWYQTLETDIEGENDFREEGWLMLHQLGLWARRHGVYLMIDLHGAPGGQSTSWHQGLTDAGHLWDHSECVDKTVRLWQALASYFAGDAHVAVYDLLNEPMNFPDPEDYREVHDAIYAAIRAVDADHIVMIEDAYRPISDLTSPQEMGWENAMFSIHKYPGGTSAQDYLERIDEGLRDLEDVWPERFGCPLFLGEFNGADGTDSASWAAASMDLVLARLNARGVHWAPWTWKYFSESTWGLYHPAQDPGQKIDVRDASFEELLAAFNALHSQNFIPDADYEEALSGNAGAPPAPLYLGEFPPQ